MTRQVGRQSIIGVDGEILGIVTNTIIVIVGIVEVRHQIMVVVVGTAGSRAWAGTIVYFIGVGIAIGIIILVIVQVRCRLPCPAVRKW